MLTEAGIVSEDRRLASALAPFAAEMMGLPARTVFFSVTVEDWPSVRDGLRRRVEVALEPVATT